MKKRVFSLATVCLCAFALASCGDDTGGGNLFDGGGVTADGGEPNDGGSTDGGRSDGGRTDGGGNDAGVSDAGVPENRVLTFNNSQPVTVNFGDTADLGFTLRSQSGVIVPGATVSFRLSTSSAGVLAVDRINTDNAGVATARFTAGTANAMLTLTASSDRAQDVTINLEVRPKATGNLNVSVISNARIAVPRAELFVYAVQPGTPALTCAALAAASPLPATSLTGTVSPVPGSQAFQNVMTGSQVTVFARGLNAGGDGIATGCAEGAIIAGGVTTNVSVALAQGPSVLAGDYDALVRVNLGNALPAPYDGYVNLVTLVFSNPAGAATYYALRQVDTSLGTTLTRWTPPGGSGPRQATLEEVVANPGTFAVWSTVTAALDTQLTSVLGQVYTDVKTIGGDVRALITQFEVGSRLRLTGTTNANQYTINESWRSLVFTWRFRCPAGDTGCARRPLQLANTRYAPINVNYNAAVAYEPFAGTPGVPERFKVTTDAHNVPFSYGALVLIALSELVYPSIPGCTSCRSIGDVLTTIINCANLGTTIANALNGALGVQLVSASQATGFCTNALTALGMRIEDSALSLTVGGTNPTLGTKQQGLGGGGTFYLEDRNQDLKTELLRDLTMYLQWVDPMNAAMTQDITAPITGYGREAATDCASDAACGATQSCQAIPHYLEVRAVETTCRKAVGTVAGRAACTMDAECRSGVCVRAMGASSGQCLATCRVAGECGGAACVAERTTLNLEPVRAGLGVAPVMGCGL